MKKSLTKRDIKRIKDDYIYNVLPAYLNQDNLTIRSFFLKSRRDICVIRFRNKKFNGSYPTYIIVAWKRGKKMLYKELARYPGTHDKIRISSISLKRKAISVIINCGPYNPKYLYKKTLQEKIGR